MLKLRVAYEGTRYLGWQLNGSFPTIELELSKAFLQIFQKPIPLLAASRTDRGVHAEGQIVSANVPSSLSLDKLKAGLNALLPYDIVVRDVEVASEDFHPTLLAKSKTYRYEICYGSHQLPRNRLFSWHFPYPLSFEAMEHAASCLIGTHDFKSFCNQKENESYEHHIRTLESIKIHPLSLSRLQIEVKGPKFLYKMVRNLAGTLAYVGVGKISPDSIPHILQAKSRPEAGVTAPAHGLTLFEVEF